MTISQGFADARSRARQGVVGDWVYADGNRRQGDGINAHPQAVQVSTVTLTDQGDDDDVIITINGVDVTINTGTGLALAAIGAALAEAINEEPLVRGQVVATFDTATLTLTGLTPGLAFTLSIADDPDSVLSADTEVTAADTADAVPFGRCVVYTGRNTGESEQLVATPYAALFTAQIIHVTPTFVDAAEIEVAVYEIRGSERHHIKSAVAASGTSVAVTIDSLVAALNTALPAASMVATDGTTHLILTAEVPGREYDVEVRHLTGGASSPTFTVDYNVGPTVSTSLHRALRGISLYSPSDAAAAVEGTEGTYAANEGVKFATRGVVWVESAQTPATGGVVYVETVAGATQGRFYTDASATRVALSRAVATWERDGLVATDSLAAVRLEA